MTRRIEWGDEALSLVAGIDDEGRVRLNGGLPLAELITTERSRSSGSRYDRTDLGLDLRYVDHRASGQALEVDLRDPRSSLLVTVRYSRRPGTPVVSSAVHLHHDGDGEPVDVLFVSSLALGDPAWTVADSTIHLADSSWLSESRWRHGTFAELGQPDVSMAAHGGASPRGCLAVLGRGPWSTGEQLPMGALERADGSTTLWQVESNGGWRWQLAESPGADGSGILSLVTSGPTDADNQWSVRIGPGEGFTTPTTTVAFAADFEDAVAAMTDFRRADLRPFAGNAGLPVIYNDYMDTLMADPTTEKLLPLIAAAGTTGAEIFVVDAGWYSEEPSWWDTVGSWEASTTRFPGGIIEVFDAIRAVGMTPGLWFEPEVVGVRNPIADTLPPRAFFRRNGRRLVVDGRYQLDFRHPAARAHLDSALDRAVAEYGLGYVKFDYNINPLWGTDESASSPGDGLLASMRAFLDWIDALHARHPNLIIENCSSGGMRGDWLSVSHFALLSTSDQQDPLRNVPIAASSTMLVPPELAGVWSYPQATMSEDVAALTLASSVLRRPILSGRLDLMSDDQLQLVRDFVTAHRSVRDALPRLHSTWPLGLPTWNDEWVAAGLAGPGEAYLTVWRRGGADSIELPLDRLLARMGVAATTVEQVFPPAPIANAELVGTTLKLALRAPSAVVLRFL